MQPDRIIADMIGFPSSAAARRVEITAGRANRQIVGEPRRQKVSNGSFGEIAVRNPRMNRIIALVVAFACSVVSSAPTTAPSSAPTSSSAVEVLGDSGIHFTPPAGWVQAGKSQSAHTFAYTTVGAAKVKSTMRPPT
jgi:hypothetical protein